MRRGEGNGDVGFMVARWATKMDARRCSACDEDECRFEVMPSHDARPDKREGIPANTELPRRTAVQSSYAAYDAAIIPAKQTTQQNQSGSAMRDSSNEKEQAMRSKPIDIRTF